MLEKLHGQLKLSRRSEDWQRQMRKSYYTNRFETCLYKSYYFLPSLAKITSRTTPLSVPRAPKSFPLSFT